MAIRNARVQTHAMSVAKRIVLIALTVVVVSPAGAGASSHGAIYRGTLTDGVLTIEQLDDETASGFLAFDGYGDGVNPTVESGRYVVARDSFEGGTFRPGAGCEGSGSSMRCEPVRRVRVLFGAGNNYVETHIYDARADVTTWMKKPMLIRGGGGNDGLDGGFGPDRIYGGPGWDHLYGDRGDDYLHSGGGPRRWAARVRGGSGDDTIVTANGGKDEVRCGRGEDTATVDQLDTVSGCEHVIRKTSE